MINGLGVLGWGVGGIEAEAAMLGQPMSMLIPQVLGFKLTGELHEGATATDLVLTVTEMLRERGVVGKFVEFYGAGLAGLPLADRATIGNMSPGVRLDLRDLPDRRRDAPLPRVLRAGPPEQIELVEAYAKEQGLWHDEDSEEPTFTDELELDLGDVVPSIAGPKRPQDRVSLTESKQALPHGARGLPARGGRRGRGRVGASFPASRSRLHARAQRRRPRPPAATGGRRRWPTAERGPTSRSRWTTAPRPSSTTATW